MPSAPILLSEGIITNPSTNDGYGLVHIEARHGEQIRKAGYKSVVDFIWEVAKNYQTIRKGNDRSGHPTYLLQLTDNHDNTLIVELSTDGSYWNINTAGIFKTSYGNKKEVVYSRHTTANQPAETDETSQKDAQSGTQSPSSMNVPTQQELSESKDNEAVGNKQEKAEENLQQAIGTTTGEAARQAERGKVNTEPSVEDELRAMAEPEK